MQSIHEVVRESEDNYVDGRTQISQYVDWSMHDTIERIDAYLNSRHTSGETDSMGRDKPFFNIVTAAVNIWYRATDIDRKDIRFVPQSESSVLLAFVANVLLQKWMDQNRFGQFLNAWGRSLARYGSSVVEFVEQNGKLVASVVAWNKFIPDPIDFDAIPKIKKLYRTPSQLRKNKMYDKDQVDALITAVTTRKTLDGQQKDDQSHFIEVYEVHGELDSRLLQDKPKLNIDENEIKYIQQMHVVSFVKSDKGDFNDFTLYKGKEAKSPQMITHLIEEDGRTLSIGAAEYLFDAQWMQNHSVKNMKDTLDIASKLIFQTADPRYAGKNVLSAIETGDIFLHKVNMPLTRVANDKPDISAQQNFGTMWQNLAQEITNTPDLTRGITQAQPLTFGLGQILSNNSNSLFEIMTENKGLAIEDMLQEYVIPHLKKTLKNSDEVVAMLDDAGIAEIDAIYIPKQAVKKFNSEAIDTLLEGDVPAPFDQAQAEQEVQESLKPLGNKRFFKPDEIGKKTWADLMSDFQWENIKVEVVNENNDKQAMLQTLAGLYTTTAQTDPVKANVILAKIMSETGVFSPIQFAGGSPAPAQAGAGSGLEVLADKEA